MLPNSCSPNQSSIIGRTLRGGTRPGAGRKPAKIDLVELEKLCVLHSTDEDLAYYFGVSSRTIQRIARNNRNSRKLWPAARLKGASRFAARK